MTFCLIGSQPASLPAAFGQPTSHVTKYQPVRLWVCQIFGRRTGSLTTLGPSPESHHSHWFPMGSDLPEQGQASDTNELCSLLYTFGTMFRDCWQFCIYAASSHILAYTREKCYTDCYLQTNLHISFHHQSDVSLQQGTTFMELLLSPKSEMLWKMSEKGTSELRSSRPNLVPVLATRCLRERGYIVSQLNETYLCTGLGRQTPLPRGYI